MVKKIMTVVLMVEVLGVVTACNTVAETDKDKVKRRSTV